jgi:CYTH domain-containing protein
VWQREPGKGSYARPERERRFLLRALPQGSVDPIDIEDRYIVGTRLRLRRMSDGTAAATYKLAQKVPDRADPSLVMITNTYLSAAEYETLLAALPALTVRKTRYRMPGPVALSVDDFRGPLAGLVLAELAVAGSEGWPPSAGLAEAAGPGADPPPTVAEVTDDPRFTGGELARTGAADLRRLLAAFPGFPDPEEP